MRPMLAGTLESLNEVKLPVYVSPKLDGIRCLIIDGMAYSRTLKPIPNKYIQARLKGLPDGLDGELMVFDRLKKGLPFADFNTTQSGVMSEDGEPEFIYSIFDWASDEPYFKRLEKLQESFLSFEINALTHPVQLTEQSFVKSLEFIGKLERDYTQMGYEGIMIRNPDSPYKYGRSTTKEGYLLKYKRFMDAEAQIIGFEELMHNANEPIQDALGKKRRSSHKANLTPSGYLGSLFVYDPELDIEFNIGTGFSLEDRKEIWNNQKKYLGKMVTYTFQEVSAKGCPRFPSIKGIRYELSTVSA